MLLHDVIRINIFRKSKEAIRDSYENILLLTLKILKISINFCVNEDWRLTKNFINRSVFSKQEVLVLSSSKPLSISYLLQKYKNNRRMRWNTGMLNRLNKVHQILICSCISTNRFCKNLIIRIHFNDIKKLYRNVFWLNFKVTLQDI